MEACGIRLVSRESYPLCLLKLLVWVFFSLLGAADGPPRRGCGGRAGREPGLRAAPGARSPCPAAGLRAAGLREEPAVPPEAGPDVRGGGVGAPPS